MKNTIKMIASFFGAGYSPVAPGTAGSVGGLLIYLAVRDNAALYGLALVSVFALGMWSCGKAEEIFGGKDSPRIVIDEVCGMLLSLFLVPKGFYPAVAGFILFRLFDILKPFPARRVERLAGSSGIMLDDIVAGLYTNIIMQAVFRFGVWRIFLPQ